MKIVICGAGQVGYSLARYLSADKADVTLVDQSNELIRRALDSLDVRGVVGYAAYPSTLVRARIDEAEMLIAVTRSDEVNMIACSVAEHLFGTPRKIARVRQQKYLEKAEDLFDSTKIPIDEIISPEQEVASYISQRLYIPGAFEYLPLCNNKLALLGVRATKNAELLAKPISALHDKEPDLSLKILLHHRQGEALDISGENTVEAEDEFYLLVPQDQREQALKLFGHDEQESRRVVLVGGGQIGIALTNMLKEDHKGVSFKVIELDEERAGEIAKQIPEGNLIKGSALDQEILQEAGVEKAETIVTVSNSDEVNILSALLAKRMGCQRALALVNKESYGPLIRQLGIDASVSPRGITVSSILQYLRKGKIEEAYTLGEGLGEVVEMLATDGSAAIGKSVESLKLPKGIILGQVYRQGEPVATDEGEVIEKDDHLVVFAETEFSRKIEKYFGIGPGFSIPKN